MFSGLVRRLQLTVISKTGVSSTVIILGVVAALAAAATLAFLILAAFIWLAELYSPLTGALILSGCFLLVAVLGAVACVVRHRRTAEQAQLALAAHRQLPWLDPRYLAIGLELGRSIGLRRVVPLVAVGLLAAGMAREWLADEPQSGQDQQD
jgi:hypothetical protein